MDKETNPTKVELAWEDFCRKHKCTMSEMWALIETMNKTRPGDFYTDKEIQELLKEARYADNRG